MGCDTAGRRSRWRVPTARADTGRGVPRRRRGCAVPPRGRRRGGAPAHLRRRRMDSRPGDTPTATWMRGARRSALPIAVSTRRDGRPVGWVAGRLLASGRGDISTLAVATSERDCRLGRALLLHAFADLQSAGARGLALDAQAENEIALGLYRSVGLPIEREWRI